MKISHNMVVRKAAILTAAIPLMLMAACTEGVDSAKPSSAPTDADAAVDAAPAGAFDENKAAGTPVKIGLMNPEGGTAEQPDSRIAAEAVVKYANEHLGGIAGHPIELDICKSLEDAASVTSCANQFVQNGDLTVAVTDTSNGPVIAPIVLKAGLSYSMYAVLGPELTEPNVFSWTGGAAVQLGAMAKSAKEAGASALTLFLVDAGSSYAGLAALAKPAFDAIGVKLTTVPIPIGTPDATSQVTAGVKDNPGAIGIIGDGTVCAATLKGLTTAGYTGTKFVMQSCVAPAVISSVGDALDGAVNLGWQDIATDHDEVRLFKAIMAKYAPGTPLDNFAAPGYQGMLSLIRAINAGIGDAEPTSPQVISDAIASAKDVPLALGSGILMTCDGSKVEGLPAICANQTLAQTIKADGSVVDQNIID